MRTNYQAEIEDLHQFFVDWFSGSLPQTDAAFHRFSNVMATDMHIVSPDGQIQNRDQLIEGLWQAHGCRKGDHPSFRIWIENVRVRSSLNSAILATYEEWQAIKGDQTRRLSTVLFREKEETPNGLEWIHVHETWLKVE